MTRGELLTIIPARGGSTRIPRKNLALLEGRPLLAYTIEAALGAGLSPMVSTEDQEIASVAERLGARILWRPWDLAGAESSTESVLLHAITSEEEEGRTPGWVMTLPPTSPLRTADTIRRLLRDWQEASHADVDCWLTMSESRGDFWLASSTGWRRLFPDAPRRQQDRNPLYEENSAIYLTRVEALKEHRSILGKSARGYPISRVEGWDINVPLDLKIAEVFLGEGQRK